MDKMRIVFFLDVMKEDFDGVSITMHQVIKRIPQALIEPIFITPQLPEREFPFPVYECPYWNIPFSNKDYRFALPNRMKGLKKILDDFDPQLIHYSSPSALGSYAVKYGKAKHIPVTTIYHTHFPSFANYYLRFIPKVESITEPIVNKLFWLYRDSSRVFAPTPSMRDYLLGKGVLPADIRIWGRGVDTERFDPGKREDQFFKEVPKGNKKVLFVSRLVKEKEPKTLMRLYKLFTDQRADVTMVIVGEGPTQKELQQTMPNAVFTGKLTGEELSKAYASSDMFVFPSTTETFGNVVLEAMASGLPVVAANAGGPKDILTQAQAGILVTPQADQEFYDAIVSLLDDQDQYTKQSQLVRNYAISQNWDGLVDELVREYQSLV